uniref:Uncharacterized protein n=1 Tax=Alloyangia mangrovi TaxID=1779329 RepID=A0A2A3JZ14_9RHOB
MLAAQLLRAQPGLVLLQDANDLLFAEPASLHRLSPRLENRLTSNCGLFRGAGHRRTRILRALYTSPMIRSRR